MGNTPTEEISPAKEKREDATYVRDAAAELNDTSPAERMSRMQYTAVVIGGIIVTIGLVLGLTWLLRG